MFKTNLIFRLLFVCLLTSFMLGCAESHSSAQDGQKQSAILIFSKTEGFRHASIETGVQAIKELAKQKNIKAVHSEDAGYFQPDSLNSFDAVVFLSTTGNILNDQQQQAFKQFIQDGGGFVGIHAAADTEYEWPWYGKLVGAYFISHPRIQEATIEVVDPSHPATSFLPSEWVRTDEWYNYKNISPNISVLMKLDESSYEGGENGANHPICWYHNYDGGKAFYTGLGHTKASYADSTFMKHIAGGLSYALGEGK